MGKSRQRKRRGSSQLDYQTLELRQLLNASPIARDDHFFVAANTTLWRTVDQVHLLTNDFDPEGNSLTASFVGSQSPHGTATVNPNGSFQFVPNTGFTGVATFNYRISDGNSFSSRWGKVSVTVGLGLSDALDRSERHNDNPLHTGAQTLVQPLSDGQQLNFRSDKQGTSVISVTTFAIPGTQEPTSITANLVVGGANQGTVTYSSAGFDTGVDNVMRFSMQAKGLPTGHHNWTMTVTLVGSGGTNLVRQFHGTTSIVNRSLSEYGPGWWFEGLDRLVIQESLPNRPNGVLLVEGSGRTHFFPKTGTSTWSVAEGDLEYNQLTQSGTTFILTDKWGNERRFNADGYLTSVHDIKDLATPTFTYHYETATEKRLTSIVDQFARTFSLQWPTVSNPPFRVVCQGFSGFRSTEIGMPDSNGIFSNRQNIAQLVHFDYEYVPPITTYTQAAAFDGTFRCGTVDLPSYDSNQGPQSQRSYVFDSFGLLSEISFHNLGVAFGTTHTIKISPTWRQGLKPLTGTQALHFVSQDDAKYTDERNFVSKFTTNRFGQVTSWTTPLLATTTYEFDNWGELFRETGANPGTPGAATPVTVYGHNYPSRLVLKKDLGGGLVAASEWKWTYHPTRNLPITATNELNKTETMTYHAATGNLLSYTDRQGNVWTYIYDEQLSVPPTDGLHGRLRSITSPDPDGAGPLSAISTTYQYTSSIYTLPTRITHADGSFRQFSYDIRDRLVLEQDELGRSTSYTWDEMDRLRILAAPTGATWQFKYGKNNQLSEEIDPLGNITKYSYDARYRLVSQTLPDPDGPGGSLTSPVYTWVYNATGQVIEATNPSYAANIKDSFEYDAAGRLIKHNGPLTATYGNSQNTVYQYDLRDRLISQTDASGRVQRWNYDVRDRLTRHFLDSPTPASGPFVDYFYDAASRLIGVRDELFRQTDYQYTDNDWLFRVILPDPDYLLGPQLRSTWQYGYDTLGRQTTVQNPLGRITTTAYDNRHRVASVTTPDPDAAGPLGAQVYSYAYDFVGNLTSITMPLNRVVQYEYDDLDRMTRVTLPNPAGGSGGPQWQYQYGLLGSSNVTRQIDPLGRQTDFAYDNLYRQTQITQPAVGGSSPVWQWKYNNQTLLQSVTDPLTRVTSYGYDNGGRTTSMTLPGTGAVYSYQYDALDRLTKVIEPAPANGNLDTPSETQYVYDQRSRLSQVIDARSGTTTYVWNHANELLSLTDSPTNGNPGNTTLWSYDRLGRKVLETNSIGFTRSSDYDLNSNLTRTVDRNGRITEYTLDALDRMTMEQWYTVSGSAPEVVVHTLTNGSPSVDEVQRISVRNMTSSAPGTFVLAFEGFTTLPLAWNATTADVKAALENAFNNANGNNMTVSVTLALNGTERQYTVTFNGGSKAKTDVTPIQGAARLDANPATATRTLDWEFDDAGRLVSTTDLNNASVIQSSYQFAYDLLNRMTSETSTIARLNPQVKLNRTYDAVGNRTSLAAELTVGGNTFRDFQNNYVFDALNRVTQIAQTNQGSGSGFNLVQDKRVALVYNALGQVTLIGRYENLAATGDVLRTANVYDSANRLQTLSHRNVTSGGVITTLSNYAYSYDNMNRIISINHTAAVAGHADGVSLFSYDKTSQLVGADHAPTRPGGDENYEYDANGNRTGSGYTTGNNNRTTEDAKYTYIYDKEGNRIERIEKLTNNKERFIWDNRNRLVQFENRNASGQVTGRVDYTYDNFNRLVYRRELSFNPGTGQTTNVRDNWFAGYDGINPTLEFETSGTTSAPLADVVNQTHRFLWGPQVDQLFADEQYSGTSNPINSVGVTIWALADHLGTIRDLATFNGTSFSIANHRVFDSFGNLTSETNSAVTTAYRYTGKYFDERSGLSHHWNRWYDPQLGKWISEDPIGFAGGDANLGRYVGNIATYFVDPTGLFESPPVPTQEIVPSLDTGWDPNKPIISGGTVTPRGGGKTERSYSANDGFVTSSKTAALKKLGFTSDQLDTAYGSSVSKGCFGIAAERLGHPGRFLDTLPGTRRYLTMDEAWKDYTESKKEGKVTRIAILESTKPPIVPNGHKNGESLPVSSTGDMKQRYDFQTLHWDPVQKKFYYESVHDAKGALWHSGEATGFTGGKTHRVFLVVPIPESHHDSPILPVMPDDK